MLDATRWDWTCNSSWLAGMLRAVLVRVRSGAEQNPEAKHTSKSASPLPMISRACNHMYTPEKPAGL